MSDYLEVTLHPLTPEQNDVLVAQLTGIGFEGFEEAENVLKAYIPQQHFDEELLNLITAPYNLRLVISVVKHENWNQLWESGFEPVIINRFCAIRAAFHEPVPDVQFDIIITPKMSFGTGHHATTYMMVEAMEKTNCAGKAIFDFGTGTGVLAILAEKLGAAQVVAIDNDDWSVENAQENLLVNECKKIDLYKAESMPQGLSFDVILANINRNILLAQLPVMAGRLLPGGVIILSGLLVDDVNDIMQSAGRCRLTQLGLQEKHNWTCIQLVADHHNS